MNQISTEEMGLTGRKLRTWELMGDITLSLFIERTPVYCRFKRTSGSIIRAYVGSKVLPDPFFTIESAMFAAKKYAAENINKILLSSFTDHELIVAQRKDTGKFHVVWSDKKGYHPTEAYFNSMEEAKEAIRNLVEEDEEGFEA